MGNKTTDSETGVVHVDSTGLLTCPFCGNQALIMANDGSNWWVECTLYDQIGCGADGPERWTEQDATNAWNDRAS